MKKYLCVLCLVAVIAISCGDEDSGGDSGASVTINESGIYVITGESFQFTASVENASNTGVSWSVNGLNAADIGVIDSNGLYTAVDMDLLSNNIVELVVTAVSLEDSSVSDTVSFYVEKKYYMVRDLNTGADGSNPGLFAVYNDTLFFPADDGINGKELWSFDGSEFSGFDINSSGNSSPMSMKVYNGKLYFAANDGSQNLYSYNGTDLVEVFDGISASGLEVYNGRLYFKGVSIGVGYELIWYDSDTGSKGIIDINSGAPASNPLDFCIYDGKLYFRADGGTNGSELWSFDGIDPVEEADIDPGGDGYPMDLTVYDEKLFFSAQVGTDRELWYYDGSNPPVEIDINPNYYRGPNGLAVYKSRLYFEAAGENGGQELWWYDSSSGEKNYIDVYPGDSGSQPCFLTVYNGKLYFEASDGTDTELWSYDGTNLEEIDIWEGDESSYPECLYVWENRLYFSARSSGYGAEIWVYND
jgi:trimeric autotransporter adhesin